MTFEFCNSEFYNLNKLKPIYEIEVFRNKIVLNKCLNITFEEFIFILKTTDETKNNLYYTKNKLNLSEYFFNNIHGKLKLFSNKNKKLFIDSIYNVKDYELINGKIELVNRNLFDAITLNKTCLSYYNYNSVRERYFFRREEKKNINDFKKWCLKEFAEKTDFDSNDIDLSIYSKSHVKSSCCIIKIETITDTILLYKKPGVNYKTRELDIFLFIYNITKNEPIDIISLKHSNKSNIVNEIINLSLKPKLDYEEIIKELKIKLLNHKIIQKKGEGKC